MYLRTITERALLILAALQVGILLAYGPAAGGRIDREAELERFAEYVEEALPVVAEMTGIHKTEPVPIVMLTRREVADFVIETLEREYPDDELVKRGSCLAMLGLLPEGYDLEAGFIELITEEAGAFYDPHADDLKGIADLHPTLKTPAMQKMIVSHELTHALQDRVIDISALARDALADMDREYCLRVVIEGMASHVMMAYMHDLPIEDAPDVEAIMRSNFDAKAALGGPITACPLYLRESLISPYAEGAGFVQTWLRANPDKKMKDLLTDMPVSSEQTIHYEKYEEDDEPVPIDLSGLGSAVPSSWDFYYANTLGEFDLLMLFRSHENTERYAAELADGWDGLAFRAYTDGDGELALVGLSVWDSKDDATDFASGLSKVLSRIWQADEYEIMTDGDAVGFAVGAREEVLDYLRSSILTLSERPPESSLRK